MEEKGEGRGREDRGGARPPPPKYFGLELPLTVFVIQPSRILIISPE